MSPSALLIGVFLAVATFSSLLYSAAQAFRLTGRARWVNGSLVCLIIAGMASISLELPRLAVPLGAGLLVAGIWAAWFERRWNRLMPLFAACFGGALVLGLPFA